MVRCRKRSHVPIATKALQQTASLFDHLVGAGMGDEDRQAPRDEESDRGAGAPAGSDYAPHMG